MLAEMGRTKALERRYAEHLARELKRILDERFGGNQTRASAAMGISQSHLSQILAGDGAGIAVLIKVRAYTRVSLEDLLGLEPFRPASAPPVNSTLPPELPTGKRVLELLKATVAAMEQQPEPPPPPAPKKPADPKEIHAEAPRLRPRRRP